ncbi:MAG: hypothetical protein HYV02_07220 [Deltaproteobacteria bacterium]|nr:hypothetical protein [Deltaproteobacteria bacterium]
MVTIQLPPDFKEFLKLLHSHQVEYLLIGGYAVGYYGYPRATADMDVWIAISPTNAEKLCAVLHEFGMTMPQLVPALFLERDKIIRMGVPPLRIEILTSISGVTFEDCFARRQTVMIEDVPTLLISMDDLRQNKQASGRHKALDDLEQLPRATKSSFS